MNAAGNSRRAALDILRAVRAGKIFDQALDENVQDLEPTDRKLAHEIAAGVLRSRDALDKTIQPYLKKPSSKTAYDIRDILRIGTYQMVFLDRIPDYAAVTSAVELAKELEGKKSAGFVNAVLRKVAEAREAEKPKPEREVSLAETHSHPAWLVERWITRFGKETTEAILSHNNTRPKLTIQPARWTSEQLLREIERAGIDHAPAPGGRGIVIPDAQVNKIPGFKEGGFVVQDATQRSIVEFLGLPKEARVWDCCAAPGGKTAALAGTVRAVFASDKGPRRIWRLKKTVDRVCPDVPVFLADALFPPIRQDAINCVLVDAPCSATGTMAKHPDARWRITPERIQKAARTQADILDSASRVVPLGGVLAYVTCSLEPEENELQVEDFLAKHENFLRIRDDLMILPSKDGADGGFAAVFRRNK